MLLGGWNVFHFRLVQALVGEHGQQAHITALDVRHGVGDVGTTDLNVAAEQSCSDFAAAFEGDITQVARVDPGGLGDQCSLHPVLAANGATGTDDNGARIFLQCLNQIVQGLVG
ncbi:hypothetical protein D3C73_1363710 [compost metagenome]